MKYKLINLKTGKETICNKIEIDGFDYYVSEDIDKKPEEKYYSIVENPRRVVLYSKHISGYLGIPILLSTNPNIETPKVVDDVERLAWDIINNNSSLVEDTEKVIGFTGFYEGYKNCQETHPFSLEDMVDFAEWCINKKSSISYQDKTCLRLYKKSTTELLQLWKEEQIKTIYYE